MHPSPKSPIILPDRSATTMTRLFLFLALLLGGGLQARAAENRKPNSLIVLCDDLGYGDLACYGNAIIRTPHLDRFAKEGLRLTDCYPAKHTPIRWERVPKGWVGDFGRILAGES